MNLIEQTLLDHSVPVFFCGTESFAVVRINYDIDFFFFFGYRFFSCWWLTDLVIARLSFEASMLPFLAVNT